MNKKLLNETEICDVFITPAIIEAGWDQSTQSRREYTFTDGRVIVRGKLGSRGKKKRADYLLFYQSNLPRRVPPGSAREASAWREILDYFEPAIQLGLTATPKETTEVSTLSYFGDSIYTYSLKQGIDDGFLAPFKVVRIDLDKDLQGWRPPAGMTDDLGQEIEDRIYNQRDMDQVLVLNERTRRVAQKVVEYMLETDPYGKTIVFCENIDHAERMRSALVNEVAKCLPQEAGNASKFVVRMTGDSEDGRLVTESLADYTRKTVQAEYATLDDFLQRWSEADRKAAVIDELSEQGVFFEALRERVGRDMDAFDLICHVVYGQPPLTRRERAESVKKRDVFTRYGEQARAVLDALLDKYADEGLASVEDLGVLRVQPLSDLGTPMELVRHFGGRNEYVAAVQELAEALYDTAA